jgi:hypothetical protein
MVERIRYRGWQNAYKLSNGVVDLIVLADVGSRIIYYGFCGGENQFYEVAADTGLTGGNDFRLYGGHRLWVSPEVERTYFPDSRPVNVSRNNNAVVFTAPIEDSPPGTRLQKQIEVELNTDGSQATITHRITNHDSLPTSLAPWAPTMLRPGGRAILPLPTRVAMDRDHYQSVGVFGIWSFTDLADSRWVLGTEYMQLKQLSQPAGRFKEQMGGIYNPAGWGAYFRNGDLFVKRASVIAEARYPDFGCNFQVFTNPEFLELETLGPVCDLQPGESVEHVENWWLFLNVPNGEDDAWIRSSVVPLIERKAQVTC